MPGTPAPAAPGAASVGAAGCLLQGGESRVWSTRTAVAPGDGGGRRSQPVLARPKGHTARRPPAAHTPRSCTSPGGTGCCHSMSLATSDNCSPGRCRRPRQRRSRGRGTWACVGVAVPLTEALPRRHAGQPSRTQTRGAQPDTLLPSLPQGRSANSKDSDRFQARQTGAQSRQPGAARSGESDSQACRRGTRRPCTRPARPQRRRATRRRQRAASSLDRPPWTVLPGGQLSDSALRKTHPLRCRVRKRQPRRPPLRFPNP